MQLLHVRFTTRSVFIAVALVAVLMAVIRSIEHENQRGQVDYWKYLEKRWRDASARALQDGQSQKALSYKELADSCTIERKWHEGQLRVFPRSFCRVSALATLGYIWAVALFLVVRVERSGSGQKACLAPLPRTGPPPFVIWLGLGLISPIAMIALGIAFMRKTGFRGSMPWPAYAIEGLLWLQLIHALLGVIVLRGWRWGALCLGIPSVLATAWVALICLMSVTGWAL